MKTQAALVVLLLAISGCSPPQGGADAQPVHEIAGAEICRIDIVQAKADASNGSLQSARNLRGYYSDCLAEGMPDETIDWARLAAKIGDRSDENEFLKIAVEKYGVLHGVPSEPCDASDSEKPAPAFDGEPLTSVRVSLRVAIWCQDARLDIEMMARAKKLSEIGASGDAAFYQELLGVGTKAASPNHP